MHGFGLATLTLVNRLAAEAYDRERYAGPLLHTAGGVTLAAGFVGAIGAAALAVTTGAWRALGEITALPAQAGPHMPAAATSFDEPFRALASLAVVAAMALGAWGFTHGHRRLRVTRLDVPLGTLPADLDGLRIVHVTDLHLGPTAHRGALHEAFDRVNAFEPDLICVTGDIVDSPRTDLDHWLPELTRLRARHGVFAILGNHDGEAGSDRVAAALAQHTDWRVLRDEVAAVEIDGARLHLIGLKDRKAPHTGAMLPELLAEVPASEPCILLVHQPVAFPAAVEAGVPLTLAGHTHGGQIAVPGLPGAQSGAPHDDPLRRRHLRRRRQRAAREPRPRHQRPAHPHRRAARDHRRDAARAVRRRGRLIGCHSGGGAVVVVVVSSTGGAGRVVVVVVRLGSAATTRRTSPSTIPR